MPHVITQSCCSDASCVYACPVNCIQPTPDSPDFPAAEMLYVDPAACVDCGACVSACPVSAIKPHTKLSAEEQEFAVINRDYFDGRERPRTWLATPPPPLTVRRSIPPLRVAVVGSGPAGMYAADELMTIQGTRVDIYERLTRPYGLVRHGVAPDHRRTRDVTRQFDVIRSQPGLNLHTNIEVGGDITHEELHRSYDAVIYAVGASGDRRLDVPGADLPGTASATEFVAWYNGHPDQADRRFDLSNTTRAIVIGNGNVALDVARILTIDPAALADTDINPHALTALKHSRIEEVVIVGRRGPAQSSFTLPELVGLSNTPGIDVVVRPDDLPERVSAETRKLALLRGLGTTSSQNRAIRLRYLLSPTEIVGSDRVHAVTFTRNRLDGGGNAARTGGNETIEAGLVLTSIGYRGVPIGDLPFDQQTGTVPNDGGRVTPGTYVAGWIKRGPTGFIGTNRSCSQETVRRLVEDWNAGRLTRHPVPARDRALGDRGLELTLAA
jgi:ferredoxin/flavodoxin---NADP+ reductase